MNSLDSILIYRKKEGGISVVFAAPQHSLEELQSRIVPAGVSSRIVLKADAPKDNLFRDAWDADFESYAGIFVDMEKAREITQDKIRFERRSAFQVLDVEYQRATETEDKDRAKEIVAMKQVLRDLPASPAIQEAKTPEELSHIAIHAVSAEVSQWEL